MTVASDVSDDNKNDGIVVIKLNHCIRRRLQIVSRRVCGDNNTTTRIRLGL